MVTRRAEIPSLNRVIVRTFSYISRQDDFGSVVEATLETKARCRRLDISANAQTVLLKRPDARSACYAVTLCGQRKAAWIYLYNEGQATEETRSLSLTWETGQSFVDDGIT